MRLLHTQRLEFEDFYGDDVPAYAILSHKWEFRQELTYQDWLALTPSARARSGYNKICSACSRALQKQLDWIWIDTICINKDSSAELSEAINSMYAWYGAAKVCFAYLADVPPLAQTYHEGDEKGTILDSSSDDEYRIFRNSRWFSRGWTLQEMIAPSELEFVASDWSDLGCRTQLALEIAKVTNIDVFDCPRLVAQSSVARKMSWLSQRVTTRVEDMAYCMLGLFDINMPLLYGEGSKAFLRLQEEIIKRSPDQTIFCWSHNDTTPSGWTGLLAPSPAAFIDAAPFSNRARWTTPYSITNQGLSIELPIVYTPHGAYILLDVQHAGTFMPLLPISPFGPDRWPYIRRPFPKGPVLTMVARLLPYQQPKDEGNCPALLEDPRCGHRQMPKFLSTMRRPLLLETAQNKLLETTPLPRSLRPSDKQHKSMFVMLFMDTWLPGSLKFRQQPTAEDTSSSRFPFNDTVPPTIHFEPVSGIMGLEEYQRDDRTVLASCIQLYTNPKQYPAARIFWAIEHKSDNGGVADFRHYCALDEYRPGTVAMEKMFNGDSQEAWFQKKLLAVLEGETREQPQVVDTRTAQLLSLRIMPTLGKCQDERFLLAVLSKKDGAEGKRDKGGGVRSIFSGLQS